MKKLMMMAVAAFMATVNANAQFEAGTWSIQPMIGGGAATMTNADNLVISGSKELKNQLTAAALWGAEVEYQITDNISAAAGLNYTIQGTGWEDYNDGDNKVKDIHAELGYIKVPLVANFYFAKGWAIKAGIQMGFMVTSKLKMHEETKAELLGSKTDVDIDYAFDYKDQFEKFDLSIPIGISYQFKKPWVIDARYQLGLTKLNKQSGSGIKDLKNSVFMLTFGYKFAL
jgi:outer membrane protein W